MSRFFKKENLLVPIQFNGNKVWWDPIGGNAGIRQLDEEHDKALIAELDQYADRRKLGIVRISAEIADALKKKKALIKSPPPPAAFQRVRVADRDLLPQRPKAAVETSTLGAARAANSQPKPAPTPATTPPADAVKTFTPKRATVSKFQEPKAPPA